MPNKKPDQLPTVWDLSPLASRDDDQQLAERRHAAQQAVQGFTDTWRERQDYLQDASALRQALDEYEAIMRHHGANTWEVYYYDLRTSQDQRDPQLKGRAAFADEAATRLDNELQFFTLNLGKISSDVQQSFLQAPELKPYRHFLERLFAQSRYMLSDAEERIVNMLSQPGYAHWVRMTSSFLAQETHETTDEDGTTARKTLPELMALVNSSNKQVRDAAAAGINAIVARHAPVATEELNAILTHKKLTDELRRMERPDLGRHISDDIDPAIVDALREAVSASFDIARRYYRLKAKLMGVPRLAYHERNVEYGRIEQRYTYQEAVELVHSVFQRLDAEFASMLRTFADNGYIDAHPRPGKRSGAFCAHRLITQPTYILLNHTGRLQDVLTLAHEAGHGIHNELMRQQQHALYFDTPLSIAEVASTFMEDFVLEHVSHAADPESRLTINMLKLNDDISSIFRQVAAYQFEYDLHQQLRRQGYVAQQEIGQLFQQHMAAYMGDAVEQSPGSENWWVYWSHFRSFFYVYSYASGLLISKTLQGMVRQDPSAISKVKAVLAAGSSQAPRKLFADLGIDIARPTFWQQGLREVEELLTETERLATETAK